MHGEARSEIIRAHLEKLARDGRLTPEQVLTDARKKTSPIHDAFEWDDSKAAEQFRLSQARHLIARVEVEFVRDHKTVTAPAWVRDPRSASAEQGYVRTAVLRDEKEIARAALLNETERAAAYLSRVRSLAVAIDLESEVDEIVERFAEFREHAATV
jgi:hypothetical protein